VLGQSFGFAELTIAAVVDFTNNGTLLTQDSAPTSIKGGMIDIAAILAGSGTVEVNGGGIVKLQNPPPARSRSTSWAPAR
jgi:hypothetical protein